MKFGERVFAIRKERGLTMAEVATMLNMSPPGYKRLEDGTGGKTFEKLPALAKILGCRIDDLFPEMDEVPETPSEQRTEPAPEEDDEWAGMDLT